MTGLEIVGASAIYIVCIFVGGYLWVPIAAYLTRKQGLESIPFVVVPVLLIWAIGAIVGLVLLGKML
ncbi:hypothetical protein IB265_32765 [Ensifer sp. ENS10]|uniref:hypothetical protein n=1 Tax=Ensifer sp. ENS10 TaxID=2769286 RepID=UPI0017831829|nr:hypothetical protein [Ensifer sp. ENS10]MBD9511530.1 hypothetical protein [Ensifer sp. ENS10]